MREGWEVRKLEDVCNLITCGVAKKPNYTDSGIPFLSARNVKNAKVIFQNHQYISENFHNELTKKNKPLMGDILYTRVGSFGEAAVIEENIEFSIFVSLTLIKIDTQILNNYFLKYYLNSSYIKELAKNSISGSGVGNLNVGTVRQFPILLPPLQEQEKIVALLDEVFSSIDKAKENAELNLQNAKELFESYLQKVFEEKGEGWEEKSLGTITNIEYGFTDKSTENGDFRYIRITDINNDGKLIKNNKKYINHSKESEKFILNDNDLLMARTGATFAKVLLFKNYEKSIFASYLIRIKFTENILNELYWYFTKTNLYWSQANSLSSGAAQPHFNGAALKQVVFSYPIEINEQRKLVKEFEQLAEQTKKLEAIYTQKLQDLEELKKSILQKAFNGELI